MGRRHLGVKKWCEQRSPETCAMKHSKGPDMGLQVFTCMAVASPNENSETVSTKTN